MQRGYTVAVALAAAAVFLQGCGKTPAPVAPAVVDKTTTLTAEVKKGSNTLEIASTVGFVPNSKVTITDPTTKKSEVNAISAVGSITLMAPLVNDYGVGTTVTMAAVGAGTVTNLASIVTPTTLVTAVSPTIVNQGEATKMVLTGAAALPTGDMIIFATDCSTAAPSVAITADNVTAKTANVTVTNLVAGSNYKLCYRQAGKTDSADQGLSITIVASDKAALVTAVTPNSLVTNDRTTTLALTTAADLTKTTYAWVKKSTTNISTPCPGAEVATSWRDLKTSTSAAAVDVSGAGTYELCANEDGKTNKKQTGVLLYIKNPAKCGGNDDGVGGTNAAVVCPNASHLAKDAAAAVDCAGHTCVVTWDATSRTGGADLASCCEEKERCGDAPGTTQSMCKSLTGQVYNPAAKDSYCSVSSTDGSCSIGKDGAVGVDAKLCCKAGNVCTCTAGTGTAATGTACTKDGAAICASCEAGYSLVKGVCQVASTCGQKTNGVIGGAASCPAGYTHNANASKTKCSVGLCATSTASAADTSTCCEACAANCDNCDTSGAGKCDTCAKGYIVKSDKSACEAQCIVPTIPTLADATLVTSSCGAKDTQVSNGTTCTVSATGYTCTSPGLCTDGAFAVTTDPACTKAQCTVPTIPTIENVTVNSSCGAKDTKVDSGTSCTVSATNYTCTSPGLCTKGAFAVTAALACTKDSSRLYDERAHGKVYTGKVKLTKPEEGFNGKPMLFGAAGLLFVSFAVLGVRRNRGARGVAVAQDDMLDSDMEADRPLE